MKNIITMTVSWGLIAFSATSEASPCSTAWTNADRVQLHQLHQNGLRSEITAFIRWHRAKLNSCNGNFNPEFVMQVHYNTDKDILTEQKYDTAQHKGRY